MCTLSSSKYCKEYWFLLGIRAREIGSEVPLTDNNDDGNNGKSGVKHRRTVLAEHGLVGRGLDVFLLAQWYMV